MPLQSSSIALQASAVAVVHLWNVPARQRRVPIVPQAVVQPCEKSSTLPSQSSSTLLHISGPGGGAVQPRNIPPVHVSAPTRHAFMHGRVRPSTVPSQSSSTLLQVSAVGERAVHADNIPATHV